MLDIAIGLCTIFVVVAVLASGTWEGIVAFLRLRQRYLHRCLVELFDFGDGAEKSDERRAAHRFATTVLGAHRRQRSLRTPPSSIPSEAFARIVLRLSDAQPACVRAHLARMAVDNPGTPEEERVAAWFDSAMAERSMQWRMWTRGALFAVGLIIAVGFNLDALRVMQAVQLNPALAEVAARQVATTNADGSEAGAEAALSALKLLQSDSSFIGWSSSPGADAQTAGPMIPVLLWPRSLVGWLLTALAASLGAPFWLDALRALLRKRDVDRAKTAALPQEPSNTGAASTVRTALVEEEAPVREPASVTPEEAFRGFGSSEDEVATAFWLARLASLSYLPPLQSIPELASWGAHAEPFADPGAGTEGLVVQHGVHTIVAFRGTEQRVEDYVTDARFWTCTPSWVPQAETPRTAAPTRPTEKPGRLRRFWAWLRWDPVRSHDPNEIEVHAGFEEALIDALWDEIKKTIAEVREAAGVSAAEARLWFTGHSLGGALATLAAARSALEGTSVAGVVTIGQPRVGNERFAQWYDTSMKLRERHTRIVNALDPVTLAPPSKLDFQHVGKCWYFDTQQRLDTRPARKRQFQDGLAATLGSGLSALTSSVGYHSSSKYVLQLEDSWKGRARRAA